MAVTSPAAARTVSGTVTVAATRRDDIGVTGVQFLLDGAPLGAEDTTAPYEVAWNTTAVANGAHALTAVARDAAGHQTTAAAVTRDGHQRHDRADRAVTSPAADATVSGTVTVTATAADDIAVTGVQFLLDGVAARRRRHHRAVRGGLEHDGRCANGSARADRGRARCGRP